MNLYNHCKMHLKCNDNADTTAVVDAMGLCSPTAVRNTSLMHTDGVVDGALAFDGTSDYIDLGTGFIDVLKSDFCINFGCKRNTDDSKDVLGTFATGGGSFFNLYFGNAGILDVNYKANGQSVLSQSADHAFDYSSSFFMITVMVEQVTETTLKISVYKNAALLYTKTGDCVMADFSSDVNIAIGARLDDLEISDFFDGVVDNIYLFDRALTATEIEYLYNGGAGTETLPYCSISSITEAAGVVTLSVAGAGEIDIYSRAAGASAWTLSASDQAAGTIEISGLTAGSQYEFYAVAHSGNQYSEPSNRVYIYLHDSTIPTIADVEAWAAGVLAGLGVFKTVAVWKHQIAAERGGLTNFDKYAPFAFVAETPANPQREGALALDHKIRLTILIGQKSAEDGLARTGGDSTVGTIELRSLVIAAMDKQHPGGSVDCDDFLYTGCQEIVDAARMHAVEMDFEAKWMK